MSRLLRLSIAAVAAAVLSLTALPATAAEACAFAYPVGDQATSPAPLFNGHPVNGNNLPSYGAHLGADYWSGGGCTDYGQTVYATADGEIVEIVDGLGSYLDVVVIRHEVAELGNVYSMYGHISRDAGLMEGQLVTMRQPIGFIDDVLAYFSPCHLHFELLSHEAFVGGPFCSGCENAGYGVSPGYDQNKGVTQGMAVTGDPYIEVNDGVTDNRWYFTDAFIDARLGASCEPCPQIPKEGATLDNAGACFTGFGSSEYWFYENVGYDGGLQYTHTTDSQQIDNYGLWDLTFEQAGSYQLEVYVEPGYGQSVQARYELTHSGLTDEVVIDQSAGGYLDLGTFEFAAGAQQQLRLNDNTGEPWANKTQLVFDAVRITPADSGGSTSGGSSGPTTTDGSGATTGATGDVTSGASTSGNVTSSGDAGTDSGSLPPGSGQGNDASGCGCTLQNSAPTPWWAALVLVCTRRRRRVVG